MQIVKACTAREPRDGHSPGALPQEGWGHTFLPGPAAWRRCGCRKCLPPTLERPACPTRPRSSRGLTGRAQELRGAGGCPQLPLSSSLRIQHRNDTSAHFTGGNVSRSSLSRSLEENSTRTLANILREEELWKAGGQSFLYKQNKTNLFRR